MATHHTVLTVCLVLAVWAPFVAPTVLSCADAKAAIVEGNARYTAGDTAAGTHLWKTALNFFDAALLESTAVRVTLAPPASSCKHLFTAVLNNAAVHNYLQGHMEESVGGFEVCLRFDVSPIAVRNYAWLLHSTFRQVATMHLARQFSQVRHVLFLNRTKLVVTRDDISSVLYESATRLTGGGLPGHTVDLPLTPIGPWNVSVTLLCEGEGLFSVHDMSSESDLDPFFRDRSLELSLFEMGVNARLCADPFLQPRCGGQVDTNAARYLDAVKRDVVGLHAVNLTAHRTPKPGIWCDANGAPVTVRLLHRPQAFFLANIANLCFITNAQSEFSECSSDTMSSVAMLNSAQLLLESLVEGGVPGDVAETGVWRGGLTMFMRAALNALGQEHRKVFAADSFRGVPPPRLSNTNLSDTTYDWEPWLYQASLDNVMNAFARRGLLHNVVFLPGLFTDTLPSAPVEALALLRLDGDSYESTLDSLTALYGKVSPGGVVIIDDFHLDGARAAVADFRAQHNISAPIWPVGEDFVLSCRQHGPFSGRPEDVPVLDVGASGRWPGVGRAADGARRACSLRGWLWAGCDPGVDGGHKPHVGSFGGASPTFSCTEGGPVRHRVPFHAFPYKPHQAAFWFKGA